MINNRLRILLISTSYPATSKDWRGRFIADMVEALNDINQIQLFTWMPPGFLPSGVCNIASRAESQWLKKLMTKGGIAHMFRAKNLKGIFAILGLLWRLFRAYRKKIDIDIYHINWLQNALPLFKNKTPAVINVLGSDYKLLQFPLMVRLLRIVIRRRQCIITPNALWMRPLLEEKFGDIAEIRPIPFGIHDRWFKVIRQPFKNTTKQWIVVSRITRLKMGNLFVWGKSIFENINELHLFGPNQDGITLPPWIIYHGPVDPLELEKKWFPNALGLITLSRHDEGRPQVVIEAMASGLPVIASDLAAHRDIVHHGETGWLAPSKETFKNGIEFLSSAENNYQMGKAAHEWVTTNIGTWQDCAKRYFSLYQELLSKNL